MLFRSIMSFQIGTAIPKRHYYCLNPHGSAMLDLALGPIALSACASSSMEEKQLIRSLMETSNPKQFLQNFLTHKNMAWAYNIIEKNYE